MKLTQQYSEKKSLLCVGLDTDIHKIPAFLLDYANPMLEFNRRIIEATKKYAIAYKINTAFYECMGTKGWETMAETLSLIPADIFTIADAKRGDIGNTSTMYAKTFFETMNFDSITVAPYMGEDSVKPFLAYPDKMVFLLALTSNTGAQDFQWLQDKGKTLYQQVISTSQTWAADSVGELGYVVGATKADYIGEIREMCPDSWLLVPGVGAQGGDLQAVLKAGKTKIGGLLINASRSIIYAGKGEDFAEKAEAEARKMWEEINLII